MPPPATVVAFRNARRLRLVDFMMGSYFATCAVVTGFLSVLPVDAIDAALWMAARIRR